MRGRVRFLTQLVVIAIWVIILPGVGRADTWSNPWPVWPAFHADMVHNGQNPRSTDLENPASLNPIWVFPRPDQAYLAEYRSVVDGAQQIRGIWKVGKSEYAYGTDTSTTLQRFSWLPAVKSDGIATDTAYWSFPGPGTINNLPYGYYRIWVWVPTPPDTDTDTFSYTTKAIYTVYDDSGTTQVIFDQSNGGAWQLLTDKQFTFKDPSKAHKVVLTNVTGDSDVTEIRVAADAVKFVKGTGLEIYSSPASATVDYHWTPSSGGTSFTGKAPVVYIGTIEKPLTSADDAPEMGSVYCVNSVTPINKSLDTDKTYEELAGKLGTALWRYPSRVLAPDEVKPSWEPDPRLRDPLEGPIEGGIYSTPTLVHVQIGGTNRLVCFITGSDRQVYALDAVDGTLLWKGPGVTVSERSDTGWTEVTNRDDAFGGSFRCTTGTGSTIWHFDSARLNLTRDATKNGDGWVYAVYAWIPSVGYGETLPRSLGRYVITYTNSSGSSSTANITIDQASLQNQGRWVRLGSYFNVSEVSLQKISSSTDNTVVADAMMIVPDTIGSFSYCSPVADINKALRDYPDTGSLTDLIATTVYAVTATGRALSFNAAGGQPGGADKLCKVNWVYPSIRNKTQVTGEADADKPSMGLVGSTLAYCNKTAPYLYIASLDGNIRCLNAITGDEVWTYLDTAASDSFGGVGGIGGYTSTPTIDEANDQLFIGSTSGYFYCLNASTGALNWRYPSDNTTVPLGAFRYSTAVVGDASDGKDGSTTMHRVWVGNTDGRIYSFNAETSPGIDPKDRRLWVEYPTEAVRSVHGGLDYTEPSFLSPVQGSVAFDAASSKTSYTSQYTNEGARTDDEHPVDVNNTMTMYVGDMEGRLHWCSANSGRSDWYYDSSNPNAEQTSHLGKNYKSYQTDGAIFSSPNVTQFSISGVSNPVSYVYVGDADGRLYAFSDKGGAWGGDWAGGHWPFEGEPGDDSQKTVDAAPDAEIQCDIFPSDFYENSSKKDAETGVVPDSTEPLYYSPYDSTHTDWKDWSSNEWIVSREMKMMNTSGFPDPTTDAAAYNGKVEDALKDAALERRNRVFQKNDRVAGVDKPVYFEWGETINVILWNLPPRDFLKGKGSTAFKLTMANASGGSGAGGVTTNMRFRLEEYSILNDNDGSHPIEAPQLKWADDGTHSPDTVVKRCYAFLCAQINFRRSNGDNPPTPGPGWTLSVAVTSRPDTGSTASYTTTTYPLARLVAGTPAPKPFVANGIYQEQHLGINNPLAITDDQGALFTGLTSQSLAWPSGTSYATNRNDNEAHFNGNAVMTSATQYSNEKLPVVDLGTANHGTASRKAMLGVMDRSAVGTTRKAGGGWNMLENFRVSAGELCWNGGEDAIAFSGGTKFPWELGIGSADYPSICKQCQTYCKATDDGDPANENTSLPQVYISGATTSTLNYNDCTMRPDTVFMSVDVPRFQPANIRGQANSNTGYSRRMEAYVDSDFDGQWDSGDVVLGKPTTAQEVYRRFAMGVRVPPDPKIEVAEQTVDIGRAPHGLGAKLTESQEFSAYNPNPDIAKWFKSVTIKNAGNVNLPDMYIGRQVPMYSDQVGRVLPMPVNCITSSLDWTQGGNFGIFKIPPFTTGNLGYTLTKARVGDPDPSVMTIPDKRKWDMNYDNAKALAESVMSGMGVDSDQPLSVKVSVEVPLTQPIGTYHSYDMAFGLPYVPVFSDLDGNGILDLSMEPVAEASFQLNVGVRENQLTGGVTPMTLPQIDTDPVPKIGDTTPAAFRDPSSGNVYLFWSSNRVFDSSLYPNWSNAGDSRRTDFANAPWFIDRATLAWGGSSGWQANSGNSQWWTTPTADPATAALPGTDNQWPSAMPTPMRWKLDGNPTNFYSVRHHSPVIARTLGAGSVMDSDPTWLAWVGDADIDVNNRVKQDHLIFYTKATGGDVTSSSSEIYYINHDPSMVKRSPSLAVYGSRAWMFWQGGNNGKLSIMYSTNDTSGFPSGGWADDSVLRIPDCLASVSTPNCVFRRFWGSLAGSTPNYSVGKQLLDIVYAGTNKYGQNSDILLSRYIAANQTDVDNQTDSTSKAAMQDALPSSMAQPMPRVFNEQLKRDSKYGFYASQHLAWIRPNTDSPVVDSWGRTAYAGSTVDAPYIHVVFPKGYVLPDGSTVSNEVVVSATDGSITVIGADGTPSVTVPAQTLVPIYDDATGVYTYKYLNPTTKAVLGDTLVDFSAGVVRFTQTLNEVKVGDSFISPEVRADYTPQTWRLTTDEAVDNSPRSFIERTNMNATTNPGMGNFNGSVAPIDRLWVFWRKAGTGVKTSTIYYKTYRVGVDLAKLGYAPIPMVTQYSASDPIPGNVDPSANLTVSGARGPWEVNRAGTKVYFSEVDERYRSLVRSGSSAVLGTGPSSTIAISYKPSGALTRITVNADDVYWIEELPEQSLLGYSADGNVNEDSIYAFADPVNPTSIGTLVPADSSKIWVFWTSTRGGTSDLFWETVSPNFTAD